MRKGKERGYNFATQEYFSGYRTTVYTVYAENKELAEKKWKQSFNHGDQDWDFDGEVVEWNVYEVHETSNLGYQGKE